VLKGVREQDNIELAAPEIFRVETIEVGREDPLDAQAPAFASVSFKLDAPDAGLSPLLQCLP